MKTMKNMYASPESEVYFVAIETNILSGNEDRDMSTFRGDSYTAGDRDGGISGNNYDL